LKFELEQPQAGLQTACLYLSNDGNVIVFQSVFVQREALMSRANSVKKAIRQLVEHAEQAVDEQNKTRAGPSFLVTPPPPDEQQFRSSMTVDIPSLPQTSNMLKVLYSSIFLLFSFLHISVVTCIW
jgi:hypothetical protein